MLIEWDELNLRINGDRVNALAKAFVAPPLESLRLRFSNGLLRVEGTIHKFVSVPFSVEITHIEASGTMVRVPLHAATAAGIPLPKVLFRLIKNKLPVGFEDPATLVISLDRHLPPNVSAEIRKIWIIDGGLAVTMGRGGADMEKR